MFNMAEDNSAIDRCQIFLTNLLGSQIAAARSRARGHESRKICSTGRSKRRASLKASGSDGSYLPVSIAFTDCRETASRSARSACDHLRSARRTRSRLFIFGPVLAEDAQLRARGNADQDQRNPDDVEVWHRAGCAKLDEAPDRSEGHGDKGPPDEGPEKKNPLKFIAQPGNH